MSLEAITDIHVDERGQWWNATERLIHEGILFFFKSNLYRAADGRFFIRSEFGDRTETGWLRAVRGFPIFADRALVEPERGVVRLVLDNGLILERRGEQLSVGDADLVWTDLLPSEQHPALGERSVPVRLRPGAMSSLAAFLEEDGEHWALNLGGEKQTLAEKIPDFTSDPGR